MTSEGISFIVSHTKKGTPLQLQMYLKCPEDHFHEISIAPTTNLVRAEISRADFDRVIQLVKEQYQRVNPGCPRGAHYGKSTEVTLDGKKVVIYLKRLQDALPGNVLPDHV